ncbi:MAG: hypothetical protein VZR01_03790 [Candidatus Cryptobacteroides sp.]|nr:hypothetical protein [Candidatus Cryptobacteroides sp.]
MKDDLLNSIKDRLDSYEESAPEGLWSDIEASVFPKEKPRKAAFVPWMWLSAAAAAEAAVLIVTNTLSNDPKEDRIVAQTDITPSSSVNPGDDPASSEELASLLADADVMPVEPAAPGRVRSMPVKSVPENQASLEPEPEMAAEAKPDVVVEPGSEKVEEAEPTVPVEQEQDRRVATNHDGEDWSGYMSATDDGETGFLSRISMKASLAGAATQSQDVSNYDPAMFYYGSGDTRSTGYSDEPTRAFAPMDPLISASSVETDTRHHRPVRMSLTFHMPLGGIFGVETGASYTLLRSTVTTTSGSTVNRNIQTLKYLGIPVNLTADLYGNDWCRLYLSGGGMAEKCVSGEIKPLLWSLNAAAGAQINLGRSLGIYAEPGLSYHFDDGSPVRTIYKDRPLDFMMTLGARMSFR